jgi:glycosyltransferase involved in cell wall biosynthesis
MEIYKLEPTYHNRMQLRIAYLCGTIGWGGLEMNQLRNASRMMNRGHFVQIYAQENSPIAKSTRENNLPLIEIKAHKNHYDFLRAWQLYQILKSNSIEHLIIRATFDQSIAASVAFLSKGKIKVHFFMEMDFESPKKQFFRTWRYSFFTSWNCPLEYLKNQVLKNTNCNPNKIKVIPSGLDLTILTRVDKDTARTELKLPQEKFIFGIVGRIDKKKGQLLALEAMMKCNFNDFHLCIVGNPTFNENDSYLIEIKNFTRKNSLENRVHLLPNQSNVSTVFSAFDWTILPSDSETFGMVTIESMALGVPALGSRAGGTIELVDNLKNGLLFETKNSIDLAKKMDLILDGKIQLNRQEIVESVKKFDHHSVCEMVEKLLLS